MGGASGGLFLSRLRGPPQCCQSAQLGLINEVRGSGDSPPPPRPAFLFRQAGDTRLWLARAALSRAEGASVRFLWKANQRKGSFNQSPTLSNSAALM